MKTSRRIIRNIDTPYKWALLGREPLDHYAQGRVCVMGDAAHPTLPFLAQGANMALEDAMVIARCLDLSDVRRVRCSATRMPGWSGRPRSCVDRRTTPSDSTTRRWAVQRALRHTSSGNFSRRKSSSAMTGCTNMMR